MSSAEGAHTRGKVLTIIVVVVVLLGMLLAAVGKVYEGSQRTRSQPNLPTNASQVRTRILFTRPVGNVHAGDF